jgi:DNA-binding SARP family transcriptional activator
VFVAFGKLRQNSYLCLLIYTKCNNDKMAKKIASTIAILLFNLFVCEGTVNHYGLKFHSHLVNQDERTGMDLTIDEPFRFTHGFSIRFDLQLYGADLAYGYVCRIISNNVASLDLITNINSKKINFILTNKQQEVLVNTEVKEVDHIVENQWINVYIKFERQNIICKIDSFSYLIPNSFDDFKNIKIYFGANSQPDFYTTDVPPMCIKNLVIYNEKGETIRQWPLAKHNNTEVYDEIEKRKAVVRNGEWKIDQYTKWRKIKEIFLNEKNIQIATNRHNGRIFIATTDSLYIYYISMNKIESFKNKKGAPFANGGSQLIYDFKNQQLISYSILFPDFITYDFENNEWSSEKLSEGLAPIQQHNRFIDPVENQLIVFGGYGNHTFKSEIARHSLSGGEWQINPEITGISPRFLSAAGYAGDGKFLLMGGFGSVSGKQEESPKHFYDLYLVDYKKGTATKLADLPIQDKEPYTFGNSLVIDEKKNGIYTLIYNKNKYHSAISLLSINLNNMEQTILGEPIVYRFLDTESFCDLFLNKETMELYAVVLQAESEGRHVVEFYSLRYPPLQVSDITQEIPGKNINKIKIYIGAGILILLSLGILFLFLYRKKSKSSSPTKQMELQKPDSVSDETIQRFPQSTSSICLLGGFQVFNKQGEDITGSFSLILRQLFLFFLLYTIKNEKGITSQKLDETFWLGMDKANAANNRSVNIRKLRLILHEVGNITISNENSYWYLNIGKDVSCDYYDAIVLMKKIKQEKLPDKRKIEQLLDITMRGYLLPNTSTEWSDLYKANFSNDLIDLLLKLIMQKEIQNDSEILFRISEVILLHDNINEEAVKIKCRILYNQGQKGLSKKVFNLFCTDYFNMLNEKPKLEYNDFLKES